MLRILILLICCQQMFASTLSFGNVTLTDDDGSKYDYFLSYPLKTNWYNAYHFCNNLGQDLLTIESKEEQIILEAFISSLQLNEKFIQWYDGIWTSGTDNGLEGSFVWMTNGKDIFPYSNFKRGEPNGGGGENCLSLWNFENHGYKWNDAPCGNQLHFICEKKC